MSSPGVEHLMSCNEVIMEHQVRCCTSGYGITVPDVGNILTVSGYINYKVKDSRDAVVARFRISQSFCQLTKSMSVTLLDLAPLVIKRTGSFKSSVGLYENEELVLRIKRTNLMGSKHDILDQNDVVIGTSKRSSGDITIRFPQDLDVRYKVGVLAAFVFKHYQREQNYNSD